MGKRIFITEDKLNYVIENSVRGIIREKEEKNEKGEKSGATQDERRRVMRWLDSAQELHSVLAYKLFNARSQSEKDAARSLFSKKYRGALNDNGSAYSFTDVEINDLANMLNTFQEKIS